MTNAADDRPALRPPAHRVSPRAVRYWFCRALAGWLVLLVGQAVTIPVAIAFDWPFPPWEPLLVISTLAIAAIHLTVMPRWRYRVHRWELTATAVYTRTGWWTQEWRIAPLSRVQTVDTSRGLLARLFRLTELTVTTASAAGPLKIDGLDEDTAGRLAGRITEAAEATRGDAT